MDYKASKYNIFVPYKDGNVIIYNPLSGAIGKFTSETFERYNLGKLYESEIDLLVKKGIFVSKDTNEIDKIHFDRKRVIDDEKFKHFRIWTTSACNAHCYYCFEKGIPFSPLIQYSNAIFKYNTHLLISKFISSSPLFNQ